MTHALILSGGTGTRFGNQTPKQYLKVESKPIIGYAIDLFQEHRSIDRITIVISSLWEESIRQYINKEKISKFSDFAPAGKSRQHSILSGLKKIRENNGNTEDIVIIHDAARPLVSKEIIDGCIKTLDNYDISMPVIPVKDTIYYSMNGKVVSQLLNRDALYAGQAPEGCHLGSYLRVNELMTDNELLMVRGTSEAGYKYGLSVGLFPGDERNIKITITEDLERFKMIIKENKG